MISPGSGEERSLTERIKALLQSSPGEPWSPWQIARILNANRKSISSILCRLIKRGDGFAHYTRGPSLPFPGFYTWQESKLQAPQKTPLSLHNFQIHIPRPLMEVNGRTVMLLPEDVLATVRSRLPYAEINVQKTSTYIYYKFGPERNLTVQVAPKGSVTIWLECTNNAMPIQDFPTYLRFLEMMFSDFWVTSEVRWKQGDFNVDFKDFHIAGFSNLTIQEVEREIIQLYNKGEDFRVEKRIFADLGARELAQEIQRVGSKPTSPDILLQNTNIAEINTRINTLQKEQKQISVAIEELLKIQTIFVSQYRNAAQMDPSFRGYG